jgi:RNA ligase (TIGR02306 family)
MASVRRIDSITPIEGADAIECAVVGGWKIVVKRGEFTAGDLAIYLEIDSWVPTELAPFLSKGSVPRVYNGVSGERLRTVKLRGQISQGLLLPGTICPTGLMVHRYDSMAHIFQEDDDVTGWLGVQKWEAPLNAQLAGVARGNFPDFISKTDQERIQNLSGALEVWRNNTDYTWEITEKLDGSSMTVYVRGDDSGVCSRNLDLKEDTANSFWRTALREDLISKIRGTGRNLALQGELVGEGIQKNAYKLSGQNFYLFDIYDIDAGDYLTPTSRRRLAEELDIQHVPLLGVGAVIEDDMDGILRMADGNSMVLPGARREGIVFKCNTYGGPTFKAISNSWLLKNE